MMKKNNIIAAPSGPSTTAHYALWHTDHHGSLDDFITFMMTPSVDRDRFVSKLSISEREVGSVNMVIC